MTDQNRIDRFLQTLKLLLVNIVILCILIEFLGLTVYYFQHHQLFYARTVAKRPSAIPPNRSTSLKRQLHPFWGFTFPPGMPISAILPRKSLDRHYAPGKTPPWFALKTNTSGFFSPFSYPHVSPEQRDYLIGILGGSVAQWFALQGKERLLERLHNSSRFQNHNIVLLNFAQGGFKQPQQLQVLSYFLSYGQEFDAVINIDGFNEVALSHLNHTKNVGLFMPSAQHILPVLDLLERNAIPISQLELILTARKRQAWLNYIQNINQHSPSAGLSLILDLIHRFLTHRQAHTIRQIDLQSGVIKSPLVHVSSLRRPFLNQDKFDLIARQWADSSRLLNALLKSRHIPYFHILQPNQYYSKHTFNREEQKIALHENSPYKKAIKTGYPYLIKHLSSLQKEGLYALDATDIFDRESRIVFADNCCHYNQLGNKILADTIAGFLLDKLSS